MSKKTKSLATDELLAGKSPHEIKALEWFLSLQEEPHNVALHEEFYAWLEADERNEDAFGHLQDVWCLAADSPATRRSHQQFTRRQIIRKAAVAGGAALMTTSAAVIAIRSLSSSSPYRTATGERRTLRLEDGSRIELSTHSSVTPSFTATERKIRLNKGEAYFAVAKDSRRRPFLVESEYGTAAALGTEFNIALQDGFAMLSVTEHAVCVCDRSQRIEVPEGSSLRFGGTRPGVIEPFDSTRLAWRSGHLEFVSSTLQNFIEVTNQWHRGKTMLADRSLASLPVTMLIDLSRISESIRSLPSLLPVKTIELTPLLTVVSRA